MENTKKRIIANINWLLLEKVIRTLGALFVGIWIARYLGPGDYGVLSYSLAYVALFAVFINLGLEQIVVRELVAHSDLSEVYLGTAFGLKLIGAFVAFVLVSVSASSIAMDSESRQVILILSIGFFFNPLNIIDYFYQSKILSRYVVAARLSAFLIGLILNIYFILNLYSVEYFAAAIVLQAFFSCMLLLSIYIYTGEKPSRWKFRIEIARKLVVSCWPLAISSFLVAIHMKIDQIMIGNLLTSTEVGIYSVAVRLSEFWYFIPGILVSSLLPYFVKLREKSVLHYRQRLLQLYSVMFWGGVLTGIFISIFGKSIILLLFGASYGNAYLALVINIWAGVFVALAMARGIWLVSENLQKYRLFSNIIMVIFNISANYLLIPFYGIIGAAFTTLVTQFLGTIVLGLIWRPLRPSTVDILRATLPRYSLGARLRDLD